MALEQELAYYNQRKPELLEHYLGQFALIKKRELLGTYTTLNEAFEAGIQKLGNKAFLIKQVAETDETIHFPALSVGMISAHS